MGREEFIGISPRNDHDRDPNLVRRPSRCVLSKINCCHASCRLGYYKSEYICFGQGRAWINSIRCLAINFQLLRQLMFVVTFRQ